MREGMLEEVVELTQRPGTGRRPSAVRLMSSEVEIGRCDVRPDAAIDLVEGMLDDVGPGMRLLWWRQPVIGVEIPLPADRLAIVHHENPKPSPLPPVEVLHEEG